MDVRFADAAAAYANAVRGMRGGHSAGNEAQDIQAKPVAAGGSFADMVSATLSDVKSATLAGEKATVQAIEGKANLHEVVAAVSNAEVTLQTVVAVRDRVITAYQEILRMPV